ncbi:acyl carrier protein [Eudoraea adriatica]|uniref:acyl carrier protein n=1 Tax=Eudoraea adriatica TaxID=446681 RepID=UPI000375E060|nr:acyl carrier protein [Eudoraea adriatica]
MKDEEIKATILKLLQEIAPDIDPEELGMDDNIREVFGIDSFDFLQLIIGIDKEFGITTPEADYGKITTLRSLIAYVKATK